MTTLIINNNKPSESLKEAVANVRNLIVREVQNADEKATQIFENLFHSDGQ